MNNTNKEEINKKEIYPRNRFLPILTYFNTDNCLTEHEKVLVKSFENLANLLIDNFIEIELQTVENQPDYDSLFAALMKLKESQYFVLESFGYRIKESQSEIEEIKNKINRFK